MNQSGPARPTYIFNLSEDVWPFIDSLPPKTKAHEIQENTLLGGRELLGFRAEHPHQPIFFVTPKPLDAGYLDYLNSLIPGSQTIINPKNHSGQICLDLLNDQSTLNQLQSTPLALSAYCASTPLYQLLTELKLLTSLTTPDLPSSSAWDQISPFATKTGLRTLITSQKKFPTAMAPGRVFTQLDAALNYAAIQSSDGLVFKTQKGHSGMGVAIFEPHTLPSNPLTRKQFILNKLHTSDGYWSKFPLIVEQYIPTDVAIGGGIPNLEAFINHSGTTHLLYTCGVRVLSDGTFSGVEIGPGIYPQSTHRQLATLAQTLGELYRQTGYVGYFDVDILAGLDGNLYLAESNIRRTGGTYAYHTAKYFYGADFESHHYILTNILDAPPNLNSFDQAFDLFKSLMFQSKSEVGIILTCPDLLKMHRLAYMVLAETSTQAHSLETKFQQALS